MEQQNWLPGGAHLIVDGDPRQTLINCQGLYECPLDGDGNPLGPIVGYAGKYYIGDGQEKNYVGLAYYNYSMADQWPAVNRWFARCLVNGPMKADEPQSAEPYRWQSKMVILGAPMAGIKFSAAVAEELGCRHIFAEKKTLKVGLMVGERDEEELRMLRYDIHPGDLVFIGEELVNNLSTTKDLVAIIEEAGAVYMGIICVINRAWPGVREFMGRPIYSVLRVPTPQYRQDDPMILAALGRGLPIIGKPKYDWDTLRTAMETALLKDVRQSIVDVVTDFGESGHVMGVVPFDTDQQRRDRLISGEGAD